MSIFNFSISELLKPERITASNVVSMQNFNKKLSSKEFVEELKSWIYSKLRTAGKHGSSRHFISFDYPYCLSDDIVSSLANYFQNEDGYKVSYSKDLGYFLISWNNVINNIDDGNQVDEM